MVYVLIFFKQFNLNQVKKTISPSNTQCEPRKTGESTGPALVSDLFTVTHAA